MGLYIGNFPPGEGKISADVIWGKNVIGEEEKQWQELGCFKQCCGSGSGRIRNFCLSGSEIINSDPDPAGSEIKRKDKCPHRLSIKLNI
jgi:hypothetical protein